MKVVHACRTDVGVAREINEDSHLVNEAQGLYLVADGMGGHAGGSLASRLTVEKVERFVIDTRAGTSAPLPFAPRPDLSPEANRLHVATRLANREIYETALSNPSLQGMGSTLVGLLLHGREAHLVHVGDSRCYRLRGERFTLLTRDHSVVNDLIDAGRLDPDAAYRHHDRNMLTRALGSDPEIEPELAAHPVQTGDLFLLCSDGLTDHASDRKLSELLAPLLPVALAHTERRVEMQAALEQAADAMTRYANSRGGDDNITVALVKVHG